MANSLGRYTVTTPATSKEFLAAMRDAIDEGSRSIVLEMIDIDTHDVLRSEFTLGKAYYRAMSTEVIGTLVDQGIAKLVVMTHPDLSDTPARLTLARRHTP